jgi:hypothetical protein
VGVQQALHGEQLEFELQGPGLALLAFGEFLRGPVAVEVGRVLLLVPARFGIIIILIITTII